MTELYETTTAKLISPDEEIDLFEIFAGVLQGDILVSYFFVMVLGTVVRVIT